MTKLILIRHGQSEANLEGRFAGFYDAPLTALGEKQAALSGAYVAEHYKVSRVYASDLKRAYFTGKAAADACGVEILSEPRLREISAGVWEGMLFADIVEKYAEDFDRFLKDPGNAYATGGETVSEMSARVMEALLEIAERHEGETVVLASHATPIRAIQTMVTYGELPRMKELPWVSNASVSVLNYENGKFEFELISYDDHLAGIITELPKAVEFPKSEE